MKTTYTDQFYHIDPVNPPAVGAAISVSTYNLVDKKIDGDIDRFDRDTINGKNIDISWAGDTVTIDVPGVGLVTYTGVTFELANGDVVFTPSDGQVLQAGTFVSATTVDAVGGIDVEDLPPACFTPGMPIDTLDGPKAIETLVVGDLIPTADHGPQPIRWIGSKAISGRGEFAPIHFDTGAIGNAAPLLVSPNHRILITGWRAQLVCGEPEVLVAAKHLVNGSTIRIAHMDRVTYIHLLFDEHEIIGSHGIQSESFFLGAASALHDRATMSEIAHLFPALFSPACNALKLSRRMARQYEARLLAA